MFINFLTAQSTFLLPTTDKSTVAEIKWATGALKESEKQSIHRADQCECAYYQLILDYRINPSFSMINHGVMELAYL